MMRLFSSVEDGRWGGCCLMSSDADDGIKMLVPPEGRAAGWLIGLGIGILAFGLLIGNIMFTVKNERVSATATIVVSDIHYAGRGISRTNLCKPVVEYQVEGKTVQGKMYGQSSNVACGEVGDRIQITYDPKDPSDPWADTSGTEPIVAGVMILLGGGLLTGGIVSNVRSSRRRRAVSGS